MWISGGRLSKENYSKPTVPDAGVCEQLLQAE